MEDLVINSHLIIPAGELQAVFARSGGPGGQNVNKVNSKATLSWDVNSSSVLFSKARERLVAIAANRIADDGFLRITSQVHREQSRNLQACRELLKQLILQALVPVIERRPTRPTKGSQRRRLENKKIVGKRKQNRSSNWD